jgi:hypothetical protein
MKRHMLAVCLGILGLCVLAVSASAQGPDVYKVNYFANNVAGAPDETVRIDNPGTDSTADLCAMIYVFQNDQQLTECCGCVVTANGLRTLSVFNDLTSHPETGISSRPVNGVIKIVSALENEGGVTPPCDATGGAASFGSLENVVPTPSIRAWGSHTQNKVGTSYPITETEFSDATLSAAELDNNLQVQCFFAQRLGSGKGVCSCGTGD